MGLARYKPARIRFTWQNRRLLAQIHIQVKALEDCMDQRGLGGQCSYFSVCTALKAHQRLKTNLPCADLSWRDLQTKVDNLKKVEGVGRMSRCLTVLQVEGVCYKDSEESLKIRSFDKINVKCPDQVAHAVKKFLKEGPMLGTFEVYGADLSRYGESPDEDLTYFVDRNPHAHPWTHCVTITGFGVQGLCPFWEFQNSYGPRWRGAARGFGQIYAIDLICLYGFTLA